MKKRFEIYRPRGRLVTPARVVTAVAVGVALAFAVSGYDRVKHPVTAASKPDVVMQPGETIPQASMRYLGEKRQEAAPPPPVAPPAPAATPPASAAPVGGARTARKMYGVDWIASVQSSQEADRPVRNLNAEPLKAGEVIHIGGLK